MLLADDHDLFRAGVRTFLEEQGFVVCAEAANADAALAGAKAYEPDVCLLDVGIPGEGIAAAARIAEEVPRTTIVMLTGSDADDDLFAAIRAGASGYLLKTTDPSRLGDAIRGAHEGEAAIPRKLMARVLQEFRRSERSRRIRLRDGAVELTPAELRILRLLCAGTTTAAIGTELGIRPGTVRTHIAALVRKLGVADRDAAIDLLRAQSSLGAIAEDGPRTNGPNGRLAS